MNVENAATRGTDLESRIALWELDCVTGLVWRNQRSLDLLGIADASAIVTLAQFLHDAIPADDVALIESGIEQLLGSRDAIRAIEAIVSHRLFRADHSSLWVETRLHAYFSSATAAPGPTRISAIMWPLATVPPTLAKKSDGNNSFRTWADTMPQMVWSTLPDGHHDYYNARWYEYTGVVRGSTDGDGWNGMFHADDQTIAWERWRHSLATGDPYEVEYRLRRFDGIYRWTLGRAMPMRDGAGAITRWIGTCTDINDQKEAAEVLARTNAELEILVATRSSDIVKERHILLLETADRLRTLTTTEEITAAATELLGHCLNVPHVCYFDADEARNSFTVTREWTRSGQPVCAGNSGQLSDYGTQIFTLLRSGRPFASDDLATDERTLSYRDKFARQNIRASLILPLVRDTHLVAGLNLIEYAPRSWTVEDIALAAEIVERSWSAVVRVRAAAAVRSSAVRREKMQELGQFQLQIADVLRQLQSDESMFATIAELTGTFLKANRVVFGDIDLDRKQVSFHSTFTDGGLPPLDASLSIAPLDGEHIAALASGTTWSSADLMTAQPVGNLVSQPAFQRHGIHAGIVVPLNKRGTTIACLFVHHAVPRIWSAEEIRVVEDVGERTWAAVERVRAEESLRIGNLRKDEFLAMLAHELRNPLAPIVTAAKVIALASDKPELVQKSGQIIARQANHMTALIDDLLDVSRVTRGLIELEKVQVDIHTVIDDAVEQVQPLIAARKQNFAIDRAAPLAQVAGDHKRLVQVVANLLSNAAKYTPEGGKILLQATEADNLVTLRVSDTGIGMAPSLIPDVFQLFSQAERTSDRSQGGLGLGLALVKSLVTHHDGTVEAKSAGIGCGSEFIVRLPRSTGIATAATGMSTADLSMIVAP